jgi:hypothetical protein
LKRRFIDATCDTQFLFEVALANVSAVPPRNTKANASGATVSRRDLRGGTAKPHKSLLAAEAELFPKLAVEFFE